MRTVGFRQIKSLFVLSTLCVALLLPLTASAAAPSPFEQRAGSSDTPVPIDNLEDVQQAVVRIEAVGVFKDPAEGMLMEAGSGSGFVIDEEGRVVTNNHVVTGAGFYRVYLEGKEDPVNARVLGVSECADLAVIDLQGDGYPFLAWYEEPIKVGLDVYAAGFPLGDPEYTLTRGIVAKARADGETDWASVDGVIQHDADINPGNSGGPLVTADGQVVGVNYAGDRNVNQFFAIGYDEAVRVVEQLLAGNDVDSIGVNGRAILSDDGQLSGIWVSSVASGSQADAVGMEPGDIILSLESLPVGEDGTMSTYCEILRSHSADDVMAVEVLRLDTDEVLEGQLNGRQLEQSLSLADQTGGEEAPQQETGTDAETPAAAETYEEFVEVTDGQGIFTFNAPAEWTDVADGDWIYADNNVGSRFDISPDLANFFDNWGIPGAILRYSESLPQEMSVEDLVDAYTLEESCTKGERGSQGLGDFSVVYQRWNECSGTTTSGVMVVLVPTESQAYYVLIELYGGEQRDFNAWDTILDSLVVTPPNGAEPAPEPTTTTDSPLFDLVDTSELAYSYVALEDAAISALIPEEYGDIEYSEWTTSDGEALGYIVTAAPNIDDFRNTWTTPGVIVKSAIGLTEELDADEMLTDDSLAETCTFDDRYTYVHEAFDATYNVVYDVYNECDGTDTSYVLLMAQSDPIDQVIFADYLVVDDADVEAFNTFADSFYLDADLASAPPADTGEGTTPSETGPVYTSVTDDSATISVRVPESWSDVVSEDWDLGDGPIGVSLSVAPDVQDFNDRWDTPGVFIGVSEDVAAAFTPDEVLDVFEFSDDCTYDSRYDYETDTLEGGYDMWLDCGSVEGSNFVVLAANPVGESSPIILLYTLLPTEEDRSVFGELVSTLGIAGAVESSQASEQEQLLSNPTATVAVDRLNVRSGPGTNFNRVGAVERGDALIVTGQVNNCGWLQIVTPDELEGWVSGSSQYVTLDARCADIPEVETPSAPAGGGTGSSQGGSSSGGQASSGNASQGCYLFQNGLGTELTITFTNRDSGKGETFKIAGNGEIEKCFAPGRYTYTLDAPPPWGSTNGELTVEAGDTFLFPINPD
ncbi:MAG: trypsin-like peptidase domain-containing protein [Caldilinea sp.]|nr:trypsin-like peptidase domain-containing protein [Caldilinea sp.]